MPAGFVVRNATDETVVQVDDTYANLSLRAKHTVTTVASEAGGISGTCSYTAAIPLDSPETPVIALRCATHRAMLKYLSLSADEFVVYTDGPIGTSVDVYVFDRPVASGNTHGLRVYDSSGGLTFDSANKYIRVIDVEPNILTAWSETYAPGKTYAAIISGGRGRQTVIAGGPAPNQYTVFWGFGARVNGATVEAQYSPITSAGPNSGSPPWPSASPSPASVLVLDVTGY